MKLRDIFGGDVRQFGMIFALVALVAFFQAYTDGLVLTPVNMMNLLNGNAYILVLAVGMVLVIIAGHIDLSVGSVAAFAGLVTAVAMRDWGIAPWLAVLLCLGTGAVIGAWQGFWVAHVGVPAFVVTLGGMMLFRGANQWLGKSNTVPVPPLIQSLGGGYLPEVGPHTGYNNLTLLIGAAACLCAVAGALRARRATLRLGGEVIPASALGIRLVLLSLAIAYVTYLYATGRPGTSLPMPGLILFALVLVYTFIAGRTILGRHVYAVGGNTQAAMLSGVDTRRVNFIVIMNMSVLASLAGLMFVGRATASGPFDGVSWELDAISAVFIGGAAVSGGVGTVIGSVVGGLVMAVLNNGLQLMGVGADMTQVIKGLVLLIAVAFDVYNKSHGRPSIICLVLRSRKPAQALGAEEAGAPGGKPERSGGRMQTVVWSSVTAVLAVSLVVVFCAGGRRGAGPAGGKPGAGFAAGSMIGISLPQKGSENWVLAEQLFKNGLKASGYSFDVQFANGGVPEQQNQIQAMLARDARVLVVGAIDGAQLGSQLREAKGGGVYVIAYDRLLLNTPDVDYYVTYDPFKIGRLQGNALLEGLGRHEGRPPWNIELFAGSSDDANSVIYYKGAMSVLGPRIADGTLVVQSGQTTFAQAATQGWKAENAQRRMDTLLAGAYTRKELDGVLAPNDTLARVILTSAKAAGRDLPVVTGQDSEVESIKSILRGEQYATINVDTAGLVRHAIVMVNDLQRGETPEINDDRSYDNGVKTVPAYLLEPQIVTLDNIRRVYADNPALDRIVNPGE
jgi:putative multiple sugar transport system permease protein